MSQPHETTRIDWEARARYIAEQLRPIASNSDGDCFVADGFGLLKSAGYFKALIPVDLGGSGASIEDICASVRIIGAVCGSTALAFAMHSHIVAAATWRREHQGAPTEGLLKRVAAEDLICVSSGGSDWLGSGGNAEKVEGGFQITATKPFASGSPVGDLLVTSAVYDDPVDGPTVLHFAVPLKGDHVTQAQTWQALGMRGTGSNDVVLDKVFVPDAAVSGRRPAGPWHLLFHTISMIAFPIIYSAYAGIAQGARALALESAAKRSYDPLLAQKVGEMENSLCSTLLAHERMVTLAETAQPGPATTSAVMTCRTLVGEQAIATVTKAMEVVGGASFYRKSALERMFRDVQAARFHPLQRKQQLDLTARVSLGWPIDS